ncbi:MAG TPA: tetratricopeptide repeat protein, partial [Pseudomonadales bacterium]|nr:tetratricopeptide repeat protein [Pseudomonadales bacterium]
DEQAHGEEPAADDFLGQIAHARASGRHEDAIAALHAAHKAEPEKHEYQVLLADIYFEKGWYDEAQGIIENIPEKTEGLPLLKARLYLAREAEQGPELSSLQAQLAQQPENAELLYFMACQNAVRGDLDGALELFLEVLKRDRKVRDDGARKALLSLFDILGKDDPRVTQYRRRMFNYMH